MEKFYKKKVLYVLSFLISYFFSFTKLVASDGLLPVRGLVNNVNTCYQNALCQSLFRCHGVRDTIFNQLARNRTILGNNLLKDFAATFIGLADQNTHAYDPKNFALQVWNYKDAFGRSPFLYHGQADAEELFNLIHDQFESLHSPWRNGDGIQEASKITCRSCGDIHEDVSATSGVAKLALCFPTVEAGGVAINPDDQFPLDALITTVINEETELNERVSQNGIECDTCSARDITAGIRDNIFGAYRGTPRYRYNATQNKSVVLDPHENFLILHIKRFKRDRAGNVSLKIQNPVLCPSGEFSFVDYSGIQHDFVIDSLVMHRGTFGGGHYFSLSRDAYCNDSRAVSGGSQFQEALNTGCFEGAQIYMVMCSRKGYVPKPLADFSHTASPFLESLVSPDGISDVRLSDSVCAAAATVSSGGASSTLSGNDTGTGSTATTSWFAKFPPLSTIPEWLKKGTTSFVAAGTGVAAGFVAALGTMAVTGYYPPTQTLANAALAVPAFVGGVAASVHKKRSRPADAGETAEQKKHKE